MNFIVREAEISRVEEIYDVLLRCSDETDFLACGSSERKESMPLERFREFIASGATTNNRFFICLYNDKVVGMLGMHEEARDRFKHRISLGMNILKSHWGRGGGRLLLEAAIDHFNSVENLTKLELEVRSDNEGAIALYKKLGFEVEGELKNHFLVDSTYYSAYRMTIIKNSSSSS